MRDGLKTSRILICDDMVAVTSSGWVIGDGGFTLATDKTDKTVRIPLQGLVVGDVITGYRVLGRRVFDGGASSGSVGTVSAQFKSYSNTGTAVTSVAGGSIPASVGSAEATIDSISTLDSNLTVVANTTYYIDVLGATDSGVNSFVLQGVEIDVKRTI